jgi:hypothetical protein
MSRDLFDTDEEYKQQLMKELIDIASELGWQIAIPETEEDDTVPGLIIGEPEYVEEVLEALDNAGFKV